MTSFYDPFLVSEECAILEGLSFDFVRFAGPYKDDCRNLELVSDAIDPFMTPYGERRLGSCPRKRKVAANEPDIR